MRLCYNKLFLDKNVIKEGIVELLLNNYDTQLKKDDLPGSITTLFLLNYNQLLVKDSIPNSIIKLFLRKYNKKLTPESIPESVIDLTLIDYNQELEINSIPKSVQSLYLGKYNKILKEDIITNPNLILKTTSKSKIFLQNLPNSVNNLTVQLNDPIELTNLPVTLKKLIILNFNDSIIKLKVPFYCEVVYAP